MHRQVCPTLFASLLVAGCTIVPPSIQGPSIGFPTGFGTSGSSVNLAPGAAASGPSTARGPNEDEHWFQPDDFFYSDREWNSGYIYVRLSKMKQAPSAQSKNEAQFFDLNDSKEVWTTHWWKSRVATSADLVLGNMVICSESRNLDGIFRAPENKEYSRSHAWFMGKITDTSDAYKGFVRVDTYHCAPEALRVPTR